MIMALSLPKNKIKRSEFATTLQEKHYLSCENKKYGK